MRRSEARWRSAVARRVARVDPWLAGILALALVVRVWGIRFGLPHTLTRPDEESIAGLAMRFFGRNPNPEFFRYPSLLPYLVAILHVAFLNVGRLAGWFRSESGFIRFASEWPLPFFLVQRWLVATLGAASVLPVYAMARRVTDTTTARVAAFFLALAYLHARDSHFGVTDVPMTFFVVCSVACAVRYLQEGRTWNIIAASALAGLAASTKYNGALALVPVVLAVFFGRVTGANDALRPASRVALAGLCAGVAVLAFLAGTPYALLDAPRFWSDFAAESVHLREGHVPGMPRGWEYHLLVSLRYGLTWPLLAAGLLGSAVLIATRGRAGLVVLSFPIAYYLAIGYGRTAFVRYMVPVIPFLCVAAAVLVTRIVQWVSRGASPWRARAALAVLSGLLVAPSAVSIVRIDTLLSRTDTRLLAAQRVAERWPGGATLFQSGSIYAQVQFWPQPWGRRYVEYRFDEGTRTFADAAGRAGLPDLVILASSPLPTYEEAVPALRAILAERYTLVDRIGGATTGGPGTVYDAQDALYLPLAGFEGVARPGPTIDIYERRDRSGTGVRPR